MATRTYRQTSIAASLVQKGDTRDYMGGLHSLTAIDPQVIESVLETAKKQGSKQFLGALAVLLRIRFGDFIYRGPNAISKTPLKEIFNQSHDDIEFSIRAVFELLIEEFGLDLEAIFDGKRNLLGASYKKLEGTGFDTQRAISVLVFLRSHKAELPKYEDSLFDYKKNSLEVAQILFPLLRKAFSEKPMCMTHKSMLHNIAGGKAGFQNAVSSSSALKCYGSKMVIANEDRSFCAIVVENPEFKILKQATEDDFGIVFSETFHLKPQIEVQETNLVAVAGDNHIEIKAESNTTPYQAIPNLLVDLSNLVTQTRDQVKQLREKIEATKAELEKIEDKIAEETDRHSGIMEDLHGEKADAKAQYVGLVNELQNIVEQLEKQRIPLDC